MYPGSATTVQKTVIARYETVGQCEAARRNIDAKYNTSIECVIVGKKKV
jgi:hypothetical protein